MVALLWPLTDPQVTRRRLSEMTGSGRAVAAVESVLGDVPSAMARRARALLPHSPASLNKVQRLMAAAGFDGAWPAIAFSIVQLALPLAVVLIGVIVYGTGRPLVLTGLAAMISYYLPHLWLGRQIEARRTEVRNGLPDAIDLLIVCIEAGSGIDQALLKVADELGIAYPTLARQLELTTAEMRAGKPRVEAFKNFAERTEGRRRPGAGRHARADRPLRDQPRPGAAYARRHLAHQAAPASRGARRQARRQAVVPACLLSVPGVLSGRARAVTAEDLPPARVGDPEPVKRDDLVYGEGAKEKPWRLGRSSCMWSAPCCCSCTSSGAAID